MRIREFFTDRSKGDDLGGFWLLYRLRERAVSRLWRDLLTYLANRSAHRHGGYIGPGAVIQGIPVLPHGLHRVYISRYAVIGPGCRIYQNVTIGEIGHRAPVIGPGCLIGAGAILVGGITVGEGARIGAGAVVRQDVPARSIVLAAPPCILERSALDDKK